MYSIGRFRLGKKLLLGLVLTSLLAACNAPENKATQKAEAVIAQAVEKHGGDRYQSAAIAFIFRGKHYKTVIDDGRYRYARQYQDSTGKQIREVLTNDSVYRTVNGEQVSLKPQTKQSLRGTLNAINYFFLLPYHLTDEQVKPTYLDSTTIQGEPYHKIKVTFDNGQSNQAHEDIYLYWFHKDHYTMDYLAYKYFVSGGGMRFRVANNVRDKGGIRFQDYLNMAPESKNADFMKIDSLYEAGALEKVSEINKDSIRVTPL